MLRVNNIFSSIDGEVNAFGQGTMSIFIRLAGCNLDCVYCDAPEAKEYNESDRNMAASRIVKELPQYSHTKKVTITGGEPLLQKDLRLLVEALGIEGYSVTVETNGTQEVWYNADCFWVIDYKLTENSYFLAENLPKLRFKDFIKFVIANEPQLLRAIKIIKSLQSATEARFAISPVCDNNGFAIHPKKILSALEAQCCTAVLNVQLHKLLGLE